MYCRNCGNQMQDAAQVCVHCGCAKGTGNKYCPNCGSETAPGAAVCLKCGIALTPQAVGDPAAQKSKLAAGLLGIFLGGFGVHNFYLGYTQRAVIQLVLGLLGFLTCGITSIGAAIWGLVEGIMILTGSIKVDGKGNPLKE